MKQIISIIVLVVAIVGLGWALGQREDAQNAGETAVRTLTGVKWQWVKTVDSKGAVIEPADAAKFVAEFGNDGRFVSSTDCNRLAGTYVADGEVLSIGSLVSTKMYCEGSREADYSEAIALATSHVIEGDTLTVNLNRDAGVMTFTAVTE